MACPDEETLLALCRGALDAAGRAAVQAHLGTCDECRVLVSALARSSLAGEPLAPAPGAAAATWSGPTALDSPRTPSAPPADAWRPARALAKAASPLTPGTVIAEKYRVEEVLGSGGMGVVVGAHHLELDRKVAVKLLLPAAREVPGAVARFLREGRAAARLRSEHVAQALDAGVLPDGAPYLVLERLEGHDLAAELAARGRLSPQDAVHYVLQAADAIAEAHEAGIVHRDLKPSNLFLARRRDGAPLVKVLDFGISKVTEPAGDMTTSATFLGSPRYMSPEQMVSAKAVDARTDVWALGLVLFELVAGRTPWEADTVQGLCALIMAAPAPRLGALVPGVPPALEDAVGRCLAKRPELRFPTVAALARALGPVAPPEARFLLDRLARARTPEGQVPGHDPKGRTVSVPAASLVRATGPEPAGASPTPRGAQGPGHGGRRRATAWLLPATAFALGVIAVGGGVLVATRGDEAPSHTDAGPRGEASWTAQPATPATDDAPAAAATNAPADADVAAADAALPEPRAGGPSAPPAQPTRTPRHVASGRAVPPADARPSDTTTPLPAPSATASASSRALSERK